MATSHRPERVRRHLHQVRPWRASGREFFGDSIRGPQVPALGPAKRASLRDPGLAIRARSYLMATAAWVVKVRRVSAGYWMSFLPVAAAPAVPAPAPAPAPIAAPPAPPPPPGPPPASPPMSAPAAAPPPMNPASRLPLPPSVRPDELVVIA